MSDCAPSSVGHCHLAHTYPLEELLQHQPGGNSGSDWLQQESARCCTRCTGSATWTSH